MIIYLCPSGMRTNSQQLNRNVALAHSIIIKVQDGPGFSQVLTRAVRGLRIDDLTKAIGAENLPKSHQLRQEGNLTHQECGNNGRYLTRNTE